MAGVKRTNLDALFSQYVRARAGWRCEACGQTEGLLDCAHILSRRHKHTRHDPSNAVCLCRSCHMHFTQEPHEWADWTRKYIGTAEVEALQERAAWTATITDKDRREIADDLFQKVQQLGETPVCTGRKRAKKKAAMKKARAKVGSATHKRKVSGEVVKRETDA